jgi:hypothetical protein
MLWRMLAKADSEARRICSRSIFKGRNLCLSQWDLPGALPGDLLVGMSLLFGKTPLEFEQHPGGLVARYSIVTVSRPSIHRTAFTIRKRLVQLRGTGSVSPRHPCGIANHDSSFSEHFELVQ